MRNSDRVLAALTGTALLLASCGDGDDTTSSADGGASLATVVVTTTALGDVVERVADGQFEVVTILPVGADPHDFQASARQANEIREADALIVNGGGFEEGLTDVLEAAEEDAVPTFEALSAVDAMDFGEGDGDHGHDHEGVDAHFFLDPTRMAAAAEGIGDFLADTIVGIDAGSLQRGVEDYVAELEGVDEEVEGLLADIADDRRVLVTNHDALGYFAERYDFEVIGTVIPSGSTADGANAGELSELVDLVRRENVPAVFAETTASDELARTLAAELDGDVAVVELFTESLGEQGSGAETYVEMIRTNARRIADALA